MLFLGKRLLHAGLILLGVTLICYLLLFMLPADPARQIAGRSATPEVVENIRHQLGLDLAVLSAILALSAGTAARRSGTLVYSAQRSE